MMQYIKLLYFIVVGKSNRKKILNASYYCNCLNGISFIIKLSIYEHMLNEWKFVPIYYQKKYII